jgi:hypothetical protein
VPRTRGICPPRARVSRSRYQYHRKRESRRGAAGCKTLRRQLHQPLRLTRDTTADCTEVHRCLDQSRAYQLAVEFRKCVSTWLNVYACLIYPSVDRISAGDKSLRVLRGSRDANANGQQMTYDA